MRGEVTPAYTSIETITVAAILRDHTATATAVQSPVIVIGLVVVNNPRLISGPPAQVKARKP